MTDEHGTKVEVEVQESGRKRRKKVPRLDYTVAPPRMSSEDPYDKRQFADWLDGAPVRRKGHDE
jgi:hypothetical protein